MLVGEAIVREYIQRHRPRHEAELDWFRQQPTIRSAIECAALALSEGKKHHHQRSLTKAALGQAREKLLANAAATEECGSFDDLFTLVERLVQPIWGVGELYVYDTSLRIGAKLNLLPTKVYIHAGTLEGLRVLGLDGAAHPIEVSSLPEYLRQLEPHEIEDVLCLYKKAEELGQANQEGTEDIAQRRLCSPSERRDTGC